MSNYQRWIGSSCQQQHISRDPVHDANQCFGGRARSAQRRVPKPFEHEVIEHTGDAQGEAVAEDVEGEEVEAGLKHFIGKNR